MDLRFGKIGRGLCAGVIYTALGIGANPALADPALRALATGEMAGVALLEAPLAVPDVAFAAPDGTDRRLADWRGEVVVLNFWATWCAPCRREMPLLQALHNERDDTGLAIVGIAIDRREDVQSYIAEAGISYPILSGEADAMAVADLFGLDGLGLPFSVLVGADGSVLTVHVGEVTRDQLAEMVRISKSVAAGELQIDAAKRALEVL